MNETTKSDVVSRRNALSLLVLAAMFGLAASSTVLTASDAEAQTVGMERREERREGRREGREVRRAGRRIGRHVRREGRRIGRDVRREGGER